MHHLNQALTPVRADGVESAGRAPNALPGLTLVLPCFNEQEHVLAEVDRICVAMDASGVNG